MFVLVIFDSLLKEFYGIMGQLSENSTELRKYLNGILGSILGTIGPGLLIYKGAQNTHSQSVSIPTLSWNRDRTTV